MLHNFNSLTSIDVLHENGFYALVMLTFPKYTRYIVTFLHKPIHKYTSYSWAFKKYCSLIGGSYE